MRRIIHALALLAITTAFPPAQAAELGAILGQPCNFPLSTATALYSSFESWLGRPLDVVNFYINSSSSSWAQFQSDAKLKLACAATFAKQGKHILVSVPMLVANTTLAQLASGAFDAQFKQLGALLVQDGLGTARLRIGWEFNGNWYYWAASKDPKNWVAGFKRIVGIMRATPGSHFTIDWCPSWGTQNIDPVSGYPGDAVVNYIGLDAYDSTFGGTATTFAERWGKLLGDHRGLNWVAAFAGQHRKPISIPEWGVTSGTSANPGPGDDPEYIQAMAQWIAAHNVAYHLIFSLAASQFSLDKFPLAKAAYYTAFH